MKKLTVFLLLTALALIVSCTNYRFINAASPPNNPYFTKKGDSKIAAYYSSTIGARLRTKYSNGFDLHTAYAVGNNWAVTAGYFNRNEKDGYSADYNIFDSSVVRYTRNLYDLGAGYFIPINIKKTATANLYVGIAKGKYSINENGFDKNQFPYNRFHESSITKFFIQPSINFLPQDYFHASFTTKISFLHYGNIKTSYTPEELDYFGLDKISNRTITYFEPTFDFQLGLPSLPWMNLDLMFSFTNRFHPEGSHLNVRGSNVSIGLNFDPSRLKKKK